MRRVTAKPTKSDQLHRLARKEPLDDSDLEYLRSSTIQSRSASSGSNLTSFLILFLSSGSSSVSLSNTSYSDIILLLPILGQLSAALILSSLGLVATSYLSFSKSIVFSYAYFSSFNKCICLFFFSSLLALVLSKPS